MQIEQFVMAYGVEQDRLRALLPEGFSSLRPVLRINAEIRGGQEGYLEFNTAVEHGGVRRQHRQDAARHPERGENRLSPRSSDRRERRAHLLRAGARRLHRAL